LYSTDTLTAISGVAIAIAGFSGVVAALPGKSADSFGPLERLNFRILIQVSALALIFSILPLILHRAFDANEAWRISMLLYGLVHLTDAAYFANKARGANAPSRIQILAPIIGLLIAITQIIAGVYATITTVEVLYLFVLLWHVAIAGMGFLKLVFFTRDDGAT
jgi:hypothetical protein